MQDRLSPSRLGSRAVPGHLPGPAGSAGSTPGAAQAFPGAAAVFFQGVLGSCRCPAPLARWLQPLLCSQAQTHTHTELGQVTAASGWVLQSLPQLCATAAIPAHPGSPELCSFLGVLTIPTPFFFFPPGLWAGFSPWAVLKAELPLCLLVSGVGFVFLEGNLLLGGWRGGRSRL